MIIWHNTGDASRIPEHVSAGDEVVLWIGTHPIEPGQAVWVEMKLLKADGRELTATQPALWQSNSEHRNNSYWVAEIGTFDSGDRLEYCICGSCNTTRVESTESHAFDVS